MDSPKFSLNNAIVEQTFSLFQDDLKWMQQRLGTNAGLLMKTDIKRENQEVDFTIITQKERNQLNLLTKNRALAEHVLKESEFSISEFIDTQFRLEGQWV